MNKIPCDLCDLSVDLDYYNQHLETHKCDQCNKYDNLDDHKCSPNSNLVNILFHVYNTLKEKYEQKAHSLDMFMKNEEEMAEKMREANFHIDKDFTFVNNNLVSLNKKCENFILNFKKEKADEKEDKEKDEKTKSEVIDLEKFNFIKKCSKSECNICEEQTEKKYVCTECKCAQEMCVNCLESLIRNRYYMSGGDTYISCMTCKTKLEF